MNKKSLNILILEDNPDDAELMVAELEKGGYIINWERVDTKFDYQEKLRKNFDVILSDYNMPQFTAPQALNILKKKNLKIPFIIVTGTISEEVAVNCIKEGASDYLLKDRIVRLGEAVKKALLEKKLLDDKLKTEQATKENEKKFKELFNNMSSGVAIYEAKDNGRDFIFKDLNRAGERIDKIKKRNIIGKSVLKTFPGVKDFGLFKAFQEVYKTGKPQHHPISLYKDRRITGWRENHVYKLPSGEIVSVYDDITERKKAELELQIERDKLVKIFKSMADGAYIVNEDHDIQYVNPVLKRTFGSPEGKKCHEYFQDSDEPCTFCKNKDVFAGKTVRWEWASSKDGKVYDLIDTPIKNTDGSISKLEIFRDITERKKSEERLKKTMDATIETMSKIIEVKDPYTAGHQQRVSQLTTAIAKELNLSPDKIEGIRIASLIHDIGKIGLPTEILSKPGKLTDIEFSLIKDHSQIGYDILKSIDFSYPIAQIVLQHHERLNSSGYPNKLKGDEILLEARILGVADVVEAMSSFRPYRPALGIDAALEEISKNKGILYDPKIVDACIKLFKEKGFKLES